MRTHPASDLARLRDHLDDFGRARDRTGLAELLLARLEEALSPDRALVVFRHPVHGRPTVFGGSFEERRAVGHALRRRAPESEEELAAVTATLGPSVRAVRIGEGDPALGMILVSREKPALRGDEMDYIHFLATAVADTLRRLGLRLRVEELAEEVERAVATRDGEARIGMMARAAAGVAEDLNQALAPVLAYSTFLLATEQDAEARRYLEGVRQGASDVAGIARTLRELHPGEAAQSRRVPVAVRTLIERAAERVRDRWEDEGRDEVAIEVGIPGALPFGLGDPDALVEKLERLLVGARDAIGAGAGTIVVSAREEVPGHRDAEIVITVEDRAIPSDAGADRSSAGRADPSPAPVTGTRACLFLPVHDGHGTVALVPDDKTDARVDTARILCIEEDAAVLRLLRTVFERDGHRVSTVTGGESGVEAFVEGLQTERPWDLVITDLGLRGHHGFGVIRGIRAADPDVPILMLTEWIDNLPSDLAGMPGLRVHVKPFDLVRMRREIREILTPPPNARPAPDR
ncbi:MAG: response regulator [Longimicrobiales bacterium]|nr:response regulator [Longimicrobiales bacterium]